MRRGGPGGRFRRLLAAAAVVLAVLASRPAAAQSPPAGDAVAGDPALSVDPAAVRQAMTCRGPADGGGRQPVLLVHGTFITGAENYGWNYLPELAARGYRVCTVDLPNRSLDDIQVAAESVVVAVHRLARESGGQVDVLAHSQGALEARWAVRWWPSVRNQVDDLVTLAGPNQGTTVAANPFTKLSGCAACLQMAPGSAFIRALNSGDQTPGQVSYTSIYSTLVDELITPNATAARIEGASNLEVQALCPGRVVDHASIVVDAAAFALATEAFGQPGPATAARFDRSACGRATFVGLPGLVGGLGALLAPSSAPVVGPIPTAEPPLPRYARTGYAQAGARPAVPPGATVTSASTGTTPSPAVATPPAEPAGGTAASSASTRSAMVTAASGAAVPATLSTRRAGAARHDIPPALLLVAVLALALAAGAAGWFTARRLRSPG